MNKKSYSIIHTASVPILSYMVFFLALPSNFFTSEHYTYNNNKGRHYSNTQEPQ